MYVYQNQPSVHEWETLVSENLTQTLKHVYLWMCLGLFVTASVSIALIYTPLFFLLVQMLQVPFLFLGLLIGEILLVGWLSRRIGTMSLGMSRVGFLLYAVLNGVTMSVIFLAYAESSIALTFVATASLFGAMSIVGYTTKMDLSKWGSYLMMGLIGFLIGSVINMFFAVSAFEWVLTYLGIALFIGLTVYDTQRIKNMVAAALQSNQPRLLEQLGLLGALTLYLDFVNLFLLILRLFGRRK